ncbi:aspartate-semialdehyde dehydrogenase [Priestia aryabhattai]|uniref:Aspartate-semialdehyde dehydrogenase n=1 Tax=Priestia aryabhattai TaxID=412384 RepID=A0AAX6NCY5_PRIAR|nr:aspartate-semialdehyde dehydrogenase [Priestia aryabhattai]MDU9693530.1 aspartate-semialdehyde dehydrogenase [Priestia aryabhattai]
MTKKYNVAVVGATGAVGQKMIETLQRRDFPVNKLKLLASARSAGKTLNYKDELIVVEELTEASFEGIDIALFSAGGSISEKYAPYAVNSGAVVIDNTSHFRMKDNVPLVVPEVNPEDILTHQGIIANPNCSTIQMVLSLKPIADHLGLKKVVVSTYQAVSGTGKKAIEELKEQSSAFLNKEKYTPKVYPHTISFNLIPQIDIFEENGFTKEEMKMINETKKIMHDDSIQVNATCVRVPVFVGHSESVYIETEKPINIEELRCLWETFEGLKLIDDPKEQLYPMPRNSEGVYDTMVGRLRKDVNSDHAASFWVVSDNLLKGAALNAVQIAEKLISN